MPPAKIRPGTREYRLLSIAMLFAGLSTFAILYCTQPLLPLFSRDFGVNAETASLALSLATGPMAVALLAAGVLADRFGRRPLMVGSLFSAAILTMISGLLPDWHMLLAMRFLTGLSLAGIPAVAMAYIAEEVEEEAIGSAIGLYIAGSAVGGMSGRFITSLVTEYADWHVAIAVTGGISLLIALLFWRFVPPSRHFTPRPQSPGSYFAGLRRLFSDRAMPLLFCEAFLLLGAFVSIYNYAGFRLLAPPYLLSQAAVGAIFLLYLIGSFASTGAGILSGRLGPRKTLWVPVAIFLAGILLTLAQPLAIIILGLAVATAGFFGGHSIASSWVNRRAGADRAQASAIYLFFYYLGSSLLGSASGYAWTYGQWTGVAAFTALLMLVALVIGIRLIRVRPLVSPRK